MISTFDKIADFILKHSKAIIIVWIVLLLVSVYPLMHLGDVMSYDLNSMADKDSESYQGLQIIGGEFPHDGESIDASSLQIIVLQYGDSEEGKINAESFIGYLNLENEKVTDSKIRMFVNAESFGMDIKPGAVLAGVIYNEGVEASEVVNATPELRDFINKCKETFVQSCPDGQLHFKTYLTGSPAIAYDMQKNSLDDVSRIDPFTILLVLILVGLFFRSFISSATPPVTIGIAFAVTACGIFLLGQVLNIFFITQMMILVAMMGAGCDYCIFIIARYREELRAGKVHHDALREAIIWAGESIATSGASVIIGFGAMAICSYSMVSTMGLCLALGILVALLAALTLIPSVINLIGDRIFWPTRMDAFKEGGKATKGWYAWFGKIGNRYFHWSAKFALKHAGIIAIAAILITIPATYLTFTNQTSYDMVTSMQSGESGEGYELLGEYANFGFLMPSYVVLEYSNEIGTVIYEENGLSTLTWKEEFLINDLGKLDELSAAIEGVDSENIDSVQTPMLWTDILGPILTLTGGDPDKAVEIIESSDVVVKQVIENIKAVKGWDNKTFVEQGTPYMDFMLNSALMQCLGGEFASAESRPYGQPLGVSYVKLSITTVEPPMSIRSMDSLGKIRGIVDDFAKENSDTLAHKWFTGSAVIMSDVANVFSGEFRIIEILVIVLILILLFFVMKSYLIPIRSIITILMSITWTLALTYFVFVNIMGGQLTWLAPMLLLVICLGLGMDYDILLTTRIKENVMKGMSNDDAIYSAVTSTGSVITICGLIMGGAFGTLMLSGMEMLKEFGFALCFAILVDALVVRTYIVPAVMHLLGDWNWKGPKFLKHRKVDNTAQ